MDFELHQFCSDILVNRCYVYLNGENFNIENYWKFQYRIDEEWGLKIYTVNINALLASWSEFQF